MAIKIAMITLLCLLLSNCGFHLRGTDANTIDLKAIAIESKNNYGDLENALRQVAADNNITLTANAPWIIQIDLIDLDKLRVTSSVTAEQDRFSLNYQVTFYLIRQHDNHQDTFGPINVQRQTIFQGDENDAISKYNEQQSIISELRQQAAEAILRRSAYITHSPPHCQAHHENSNPATQ